MQLVEARVFRKTAEFSSHSRLLGDLSHRLVSSLPEVKRAWHRSASREMMHGYYLSASLPQRLFSRPGRECIRGWRTKGPVLARVSNRRARNAHDRPTSHQTTGDTIFAIALFFSFLFFYIHTSSLRKINVDGPRVYISDFWTEPKSTLRSISGCDNWWKFSSFANRIDSINSSEMKPAEKVRNRGRLSIGSVRTFVFRSG